MIPPAAILSACERDADCVLPREPGRASTASGWRVVASGIAHATHRALQPSHEPLTPWGYALSAIGTVVFLALLWGAAVVAQ